MLYEKPGFQGRTVALEEGSLELANVWAEPGPEVEAQNDTPMQIGSIRLAVSVSARLNTSYLSVSAHGHQKQ